jgi:hypothetical protein
MKNIVRMGLILFFLVSNIGPLRAATAKSSGVKPNTAAMQKALKLWVFEKGGEFVGDALGLVDYKEKKFILKCGLKNNTKKDIQGVRGVLRFTTLFGEYIGDLSLEFTDKVPAGRSVSVEWKAEGKRFSKQGFEKFQKLKLSEMKQLWYPTAVVFADGTMLK